MTAADLIRFLIRLLVYCGVAACGWWLLSSWGRRAQAPERLSWEPDDWDHWPDMSIAEALDEPDTRALRRMRSRQEVDHAEA